MSALRNMPVTGVLVIAVIAVLFILAVILLFYVRNPVSLPGGKGQRRKSGGERISLGNPEGIHRRVQAVRAGCQYPGHHLRTWWLPAFRAAAVRALPEQRGLAVRDAGPVRYLPRPEHVGQFPDGADRAVEHLGVAERARQRRRRPDERAERHGRGVLYLAVRRGLLHPADDPAHDPLPQAARERLETRLELWLDMEIAPTLTTEATKDDADLVNRLIDTLNDSVSEIRTALRSSAENYAVTRRRLQTSMPGPSASRRST